MFGKKSSEKSEKNGFFIFTQISLPKNGGGKRAKQFFQKHKISAIKKCIEKNRRKKVRKTFFYIHTNIVIKKCGGKNPRNNFSRNTLIVRTKNLGKNLRKKVRKTFFIFTQISLQNMGGNARNNFSETQE